MNAAKFKLAAVFVVIFFFAGLISCGKKTDETSQKDNGVVERAEIDEKDYTETNEDLLSVDYKQFYDELAPHGEWIEVTDKDLELNLKNGTASGEMPHKTMTFAEFFGVKDLYAADVSIGAFFVWKPSPDLAVAVVANESQPYYVPYSNGQWVNTDAGWYFMAPTPYEEVVHHYGRWVFTPAVGWVWVPGRVWAPAWVDWREDENYIAWTPIPPGYYLVNNVVVAPPVYVDNYVIVERRFFIEPEIYRYVYTGDRYSISISGMSRPIGVTVVNNMVVNRGPDVTVIETVKGTKIDMVKVTKVSNKSDVKYTSSEIHSYAPQFTKVKTKEKLSSSYVKPVKYDKYENVKSKANQESKKDTRSGKNDTKGSDVKEKGSNKQKGNDKSIKGPNKLGDDSNMKTGKNRSKDKTGYDKGSQYDKGRDKGGKIKKGTDKGGQYDKGKDKGGQNDKGKGNDKGGKKKFSNETYKSPNNDKGNFKNDKGSNKNNSDNKSKGNDGKSKGKK